MDPDQKENSENSRGRTMTRRDFLKEMFIKRPLATAIAVPALVTAFTQIACNVSGEIGTVGQTEAIAATKNWAELEHGAPDARMMVLSPDGVSVSQETIPDFLKQIGGAEGDAEDIKKFNLERVVFTGPAAGNWSAEYMPNRPFTGQIMLTFDRPEGKYLVPINVLKPEKLDQLLDANPNVSGYFTDSSFDVNALPEIRVSAENMAEYYRKNPGMGAVLTRSNGTRYKDNFSPPNGGTLNLDVAKNPVTYVDEVGSFQTKPLIATGESITGRNGRISIDMNSWQKVRVVEYPTYSGQASTWYYVVAEGADGRELFAGELPKCVVGNMVDTGYIHFVGRHSPDTIGLSQTDNHIFDLLTSKSDNYNKDLLEALRNNRPYEKDGFLIEPIAEFTHNSNLPTALTERLAVVKDKNTGKVMSFLTAYGNHTYWPTGRPSDFLHGVPGTTTLDVYQKWLDKMALLPDGQIKVLGASARTFDATSKAVDILEETRNLKILEWMDVVEDARKASKYGKLYSTIGKGVIHGIFFFIPTSFDDAAFTGVSMALDSGGTVGHTESLAIQSFTDPIFSLINAVRDSDRLCGVTRNKDVAAGTIVPETELIDQLRQKAFIETAYANSGKVESSFISQGEAFVVNYPSAGLVLQKLNSSGQGELEFKNSSDPSGFNPFVIMLDATWQGSDLQPNQTSDKLTPLVVIPADPATQRVFMLSNQEAGGDTTAAFIPRDASINSQADLANTINEGRMPNNAVVIDRLTQRHELELLPTPAPPVFGQEGTEYQGIIYMYNDQAEMCNKIAENVTARTILVCGGDGNIYAYQYPLK